MNLKRLLFSSAAALLLLWAPISSRAVVIVQSSDAPYIAWEGENTSAIVNGDPALTATWAIQSDATASGGSALYMAGPNQQTGYPLSFASYKLKFSTPGTYTLYVRWRADKARSDQDANGGNSYKVPVGFGDLESDTTSLNYGTSSANNTRVPPDANNYLSIRESTTFTVAQADVDSGLPLIFKIGSREWGMYLDRFVLSLDGALSDSAFNGLANSPTSLIQQGASDDFLAWEGENVTDIVNGDPALTATWAVTADGAASEGSSLYMAGPNQQTGYPLSFASYQLQFSTPGTYNLYVRWRADKARSDQDANGGNSYKVPVGFGDLESDTTSLNYVTSSANNTRVPPDANNYLSIRESTTFTVTQADVDSGLPLIFKIGSREWGMYLDRFVLSPRADLTDAEFNALPNSGASARPLVKKAVGSETLTTVRVTFDRALDPTSINPAQLRLTPSGTISAAVADPLDPTSVIVTTSPQTPNTPYTLIISGVKDAAGHAILDNSPVAFTSWKLATGWVRKQIYFGAGATITELLANPKYPDHPDTDEFVKSVGMVDDPFAVNYGGRFTTYFIPPTTGAYEFYILGDDNASLYLSNDETEAGLASVLDSVTGLTSFDPSAQYTSGTLTAGKRYLLQLLFQQGAGGSRAQVAVRMVGDTSEVALLPVLGGALVSTFTNPDAGSITIKKQPANIIAAANRRATFTVEASANAGGVLFYQWQVNGTDIPGATRPTLVTPVLSAGDNGKAYRVFVSVNGSSTTSSEATLTVGPAQPITQIPYIGINFVGGGNGSPGGSLSPQDVAGVVPQNHYNNLAGGTFADVPLINASGELTPVTLNVAQGGTVGAGTGTSSADRELLQGYLHNNNTPLTLTLANVPAGRFDLIVYSVGFNFNTTFEQALELLSGEETPIYHGRAEHAGEYLAKLVFTQMTSTDPDSRDSGNYTVFHNISAAGDGTLVLKVTPENPGTPGINFLPAVNALQLVQLPDALPAITITRIGNVGTISWANDAIGFRFQSSPTLGADANWQPWTPSPNLLTSAGSVQFTLPTSGNLFLRLTQ